jgi:hypothetical protein
VLVLRNPEKLQFWFEDWGEDQGFIEVSGKRMLVETTEVASASA